MRLSFLSILFLFSFAGLGQAQKEVDTGKADEVYEKLGYHEAIDLYQAGKLDVAAMERMANAYRLNHDTRNAEKWYAQIVQSSGKPSSYLYYAQALQSNGKLEEAKKYYLIYDQMVGGSGDRRGSNLAAAIDRMVELRNPEVTEISNLWAINSEHLDFSPSFYENGIVFVSTRGPEGAASKGKDLWTGDDFAGLFYASQNEHGDLGNPEVFSVGLASRFHEGPLTFSKSGDQLFFTRNEKKRKGTAEVRLEIFTSHKKDDHWGKAQKVDLGGGQSNDAHPALSADGQKLYFASDREGGYGGMDIYVCRHVGGEWSLPINLGPNINTAGNEVFPFSYDDGTLYFASDGWGGLGGLDIFFAEQMSELEFGEATNLRAPFNSNMDDFGYVLNTLGTEGYFTSARPGGKGKDDLYHFSLPTPQSNKRPEESVVHICVYDQLTGERMEGAKVTLLSEQADGSFAGMDGDTLLKLLPTDQPDAFNLSRKKLDPFAGTDWANETYSTDSEGHISLLLNPHSKYFLRSKMDGYREATYRLDASKDIIEHCISLVPADCIELRGQVLNKKGGSPIPGALASLFNLCSGEEMNTMTDPKGNYSFCIPCDCDFILKAAKPKFKAGSVLVTTAGRSCEPDVTGPEVVKNVELLPDASMSHGPLLTNYREAPEGRPLTAHWRTNPNLSEHKMAEGMIIELKNIHYGFDEFHIRKDAASELDKVVDFMLRNPEVKVEMRSHTDSRADDEYNLVLSKNRAKAAMEYVVKRGVARHRITATGFGESQLLNECDDGVDCPEEAHQMNRRTEVRVYKK